MDRVAEAIDLNPKDNSILAASLFKLGIHKQDGTVLDSSTISRIKIEWLDTGKAPEMDKKNRRTVTELGLLTLCDKYGGVLGSDYSRNADGSWTFSTELLDKISTESEAVRRLISQYLIAIKPRVRRSTSGLAFLSVPHSYRSV